MANYKWCSSVKSHVEFWWIFMKLEWKQISSFCYLLFSNKTEHIRRSYARKHLHRAQNERGMNTRFKKKTENSILIEWESDTYNLFVKLRDYLKVNALVGTCSSAKNRSGFKSVNLFETFADTKHTHACTHPSQRCIFVYTQKSYA